MYFEEFGELKYLEPENFYSGSWAMFDSAYGKDNILYEIVFSDDKGELRYTWSVNLTKVIKKLADLGWSYKVQSNDDGEIISHAFTLNDKNDEDSSWKVWIEDHHNDDADDWIIYSGYYAPHNKDWFGDLSYTMGAVHYEDMKLFSRFIDILECEKRDV